MKWLLAAYLCVIVDMAVGLPLNLYGFGREHFVFAIFVVTFSAWLYWRGLRKGMPTRPFPVWLASLLLCVLWLLFYPLHNGWDVVLAPQLLWAAAVWVWRRARQKMAKRQ